MFILSFVSVYFLPSAIYNNLKLSVSLIFAFKEDYRDQVESLVDNGLSD